MKLNASGPHGHAILSLRDVAGSTNIVNHFITTAGSPWTQTGTYDIHVTTTDNKKHVILDYNPTLNFGNSSPEHANSGTCEGHLTIIKIRKN